MAPRTGTIVLGVATLAVGGAAAAAVVAYQQSRRNPAVDVHQCDADEPVAGGNAPAPSGRQLQPAAHGVDAALKGNAALLSAEERAVVERLLELDQAHLFAAWPTPGTDDASKKRLLQQLVALDRSYHGGLAAYVANARRLLTESKEGINPFEGFVPTVPHGVKLDFAGAEYLGLEGEGLKEAGHAAFVLVAGGLGERLGYSGIKVALPSESASGVCFLELYIRYILALQERSGGGKALPFAIMTSDDTHARTLALLEQHSYFGMSKDQVTLVKQEKVACLIDNDAHLALEPADSYAVQTKPHGHGDVHALLHSSGLAKKWHSGGFKWVCFFQDTNALVFRALVAALGVSATHDYDMNSLAVPRKAKEAIGAITKLTHRDSGACLTVNVEYNQLDPLLRSTVNKDGDVNDETGWSPFPGNINQLVIKLSSYVQQLSATGGVISEFVNPKYKDSTKTAFKSSTRLECMMQDYPKALPSSAKVGFTTVNQVWSTYSPVKNSPADALTKWKETNPTHSATSGELDIYMANCLMLQSVCQLALPHPIPDATFNGMTLPLYPRVVLAPSFATIVADCKTKIAQGSITLSPSSVLLLDGPGIRITGPLKLNGALVVRAAPGANVTIGALSVDNAGWQWQALQEGEDAPEEQRIRGFKVLKQETMELVFDKPGTYALPAAPAAAAAPAPTASKANLTKAAAPAPAAAAGAGAVATTTAPAAAAPAVAAGAAAAPPAVAAATATARATPAAPAAAPAAAASSTAPPAAPSTSSGLSPSARPFVPSFAAATAAPAAPAPAPAASTSPAPAAATDTAKRPAKKEKALAGASR